MPTPAPTADAAPARLGMWDAVSVIVGIIVGASIFRSPGDIYGNVADVGAVPAWLVGSALWALVGLLSVVGALCYAELATTYPSSGGDYIFLTRAYGRAPGFLFAWSEMAIIRTGGSISAMAYVFGDYAQRVRPAGPRGPFLYGAAAILALGLVNALGVRPGKWAQNVLTAVKVIGLVSIIVAGGLWFLWPRTAEQVVVNPGPVWPFPPSLSVATVFVFYAYGGWNEAGYVAAELRERRRNITRSLLIGVGLVTLLYLAVNAAYLVALGVGPLRRSRLAAADVMALPLGETGAQLIAVLIMISALGAINGLLFTGTRLYATFGANERLFAWLDRKVRSVPPGAVAVQMVFSIGLMALFETGGRWKPWLADQLGRIRVELPASFARKASGFDDIVAATAPVFWLFFLLTGCSLLVLRARDPRAERPFRVPIYPLTPLLFCAACAFMLYQSTKHALTSGPGELFIVAGFVLTGVPLYALSGKARPPRPAPTTAEESPP